MAAVLYTLKDVLASPSLTEEIANRFRSGEIAIYPTETIYGIGGRADDQAVHDRIFEAKNRPERNSLILIAAAPVHFEPLGMLFPPPAQRLIKAFWPGKLTLVLPVQNSSDTLAVRTSDHPFIVALYRFLAVPVFSTSANLSGRPYNGSPGYLRGAFKDRVDFIIDAGELPASAPSTVVRVFADGRTEVLREGAVPRSAVLEALARE